MTGECRVTGVTIRRLLFASRIKLRRAASNAERPSGYNDLLLSPHVDALFESRLINFEDWRVHAHSSLPRNVFDRWPIHPSNPAGVSRKQPRETLVHHRDPFATRGKAARKKVNLTRIRAFLFDPSVCRRRDAGSKAARGKMQPDHSICDRCAFVFGRFQRLSFNGVARIPMRCSTSPAAIRASKACARTWACASRAGRRCWRQKRTDRKYLPSRNAV